MNNYLKEVNKLLKFQKIKKFELKNIDSVVESIIQLRRQIDDVDTLKKNVEDFDDDVRDKADEVIVALDNLRDKGSNLQRITSEYVQRLDEAEEFAISLRDLYENKTEDVAKDFAKNAVALGIKPNDIPEYEEILQLNEEAQSIVSDVFHLIELSDVIITDADKLINDNNL